MKKYRFIKLFLGITVLLAIILSLPMCTSVEGTKNSKASKNDIPEIIKSNISGSGKTLEITFLKGKTHNHPSFVFWLEDMDGNYLQTLFITKAIGQGVFAYGDKTGGVWKAGEVRRPAALPYWAFKRGILNEDGSMIPTLKNKIADAYSGATPTGSFQLITRTDNTLKGKARLMLEINQTWDWNEYWNNSKYPENLNYKTSCQPALVYSAVVDFDVPGSDIEFTAIGHSHYAGEDGSLTADLQTITTALHISREIKVRVIEREK